VIGVRQQPSRAVGTLASWCAGRGATASLRDGREHGEAPGADQDPQNSVIATPTAFLPVLDRSTQLTYCRCVVATEREERSGASPAPDHTQIIHRGNGAPPVRGSPPRTWLPRDAEVPDETETLRVADPDRPTLPRYGLAGSPRAVATSASAPWPIRCTRAEPRGTRAVRLRFRPPPTDRQRKGCRPTDGRPCRL
jgi:hypothetical protein